MTQLYPHWFCSLFTISDSYSINRDFDQPQSYTPFCARDIVNVVNKSLRTDLYLI